MRGKQGCANLLKVVGLGGMLLVFSVVAIFITLRRSSIGGPQKDPSLKHDTPATPDIPSVYDPESSAVFEGPDVKLLAVRIRYIYRHLMETHLFSAIHKRVMTIYRWHSMLNCYVILMRASQRHSKLYRTKMCGSSKCDTVKLLTRYIKFPIGNLNMSLPVVSVQLSWAAYN